MSGDGEIGDFASPNLRHPGEGRDPWHSRYGIGLPPALPLADVRS